VLKYTCMIRGEAGADASLGAFFAAAIVSAGSAAEPVPPWLEQPTATSNPTPATRDRSPRTEARQSLDLMIPLGQAKSWTRSSRSRNCGDELVPEPEEVSSY
jgi:hypothetical protein